MRWHRWTRNFGRKSGTARPPHRIYSDTGFARSGATWHPHWESSTGWETCDWSVRRFSMSDGLSRRRLRDRIMPGFRRRKWRRGYRLKRKNRVWTFNSLIYGKWTEWNAKRRQCICSHGIMLQRYLRLSEVVYCLWNETEPFSKDDTYTRRLTPEMWEEIKLSPVVVADMLDDLRHGNKFYTGVETDKGGFFSAGTMKGTTNMGPLWRRISRDVSLSRTLKESRWPCMNFGDGLRWWRGR